MQHITRSGSAFHELSELAQARAIDAIRDKLAGPWWDSADNDAVHDAMLDTLAATLGTPTRHNNSPPTVINGVTIDGWDLAHDYSLAVSGTLYRDNAAGLPWVDWLDHVELTAVRSQSTTITVWDTDPACTCSADHYQQPHDPDCPTLAPSPVTDDQRSALEDAVRDALCDTWTAGEREFADLTGEQRARKVATDHHFTDDGELYP